MEILPPRSKRPNGRFRKGQSGNPAGRAKGTTVHAANLRRAEEDAIKLAANTADLIAEMARMALTEIERPNLIPMITAITDAAKDAAREGQIGPSPVALLRSGYDGLCGDDEQIPDDDFLAHAGLPKGCSWQAFRGHYTARGRIDYARHAADLGSYPPIARRIEELRMQHLQSPVSDTPSNKLKIGYD
ncbi:MAG: hypothetical protein HN491_12270 [Rhodospirillales bacterium]|nr:hypothetical protein [Rhodospirillales bacterium]